MRYLLLLTLSAAALLAQDATSPISDTRVPSDPVTCKAGVRIFRTDLNLGRICGPDNTWNNLGSGVPGGSIGQLQINNGSFGGITLAGDCTFTSPNIVCQKSNGVAFSQSAFTDMTNVTNAISGTLANARTTGSAVNVFNTLVLRDGSGNFAGTNITGNLIGNASGTAATITGQVAAANLTVLTTSQDLLTVSAGVLARVPIVTNGNCLGATGGAWASLSCGGGSAGVLPSSPNSSVTIGGSDLTAWTVDISTSYLNNLYLQLATGNTLASGAKLVVVPSATTAGLRVATGSLPSTPVTGDLAISTGGVFTHFDGVVDQAHVTVAGGANSLPSATTAGRIPVWSTTGFVVSDMGTAFTFSGSTLSAGASGILNLSAMTSASAFRVPNLAGASSTVAGALSFDTTNKMPHFGANSVDNLIALLPSSITPANNDCAKFTVVGGVITINTVGAACGTPGASTPPANEYFIDATCAGAGNASCYSTPAAALMAANTAEGHVYNWIPGTYTISSTMSVGSPTKQVWFTNGPGVIYNCTITNGSPCIQVYDGSVFEGPPGYTTGANGTNTRLTFGSSAHVSSGIVNAEQDGSQQSATVRGIYCVGNFSGAIIDQGCFHIRGLFSSTVWENISSANLPSTIGLLIDTPSNATVTPVTMTASGTTVTLTVPATTDASPDGHHTFIGGVIAVSGCVDTAYNSAAATVTATTDNTHITYTSAGSPGASTTGCSYVPTNVLAISSVINIKNVVMNMSNNTTTHTGGRPIVISNRGALANVTCENLCNAEGATPGGPAIEINGNGATGSNAANTITFDNVHCEPATGDTGAPTCIKMVDATNVIVKGINGDGCGGCVGSNLITIAQSGANKAHNIVVVGATKNSWNNIVTNSVSAAFTTPAAITGLGFYNFTGISTDLGNFGTFMRPVSTVAFSATPVFNMNADQLITLTGNVTSSTISNALAGSTANFTICQDGTGSRTFVWPTALHGATTIGSTASKCTSQAFQSPDGTTFYALAAAVINQ